MSEEAGLKDDAPVAARVSLGLSAALVIFAIDILTPLGIAAGVLYVVVPLLAIGSRSPRSPITLALVCSLLTGLGMLLGSLEAPRAFVYANRALSLLAIWVTTTLVLQHQRHRRAQDAERERSLQRLRRLIESAPDGMIVVEKDGRVSLANAAAQQILGLGSAELLGARLDALLPDLEAERYAHLLGESDGASRGLSRRVRRPDGVERTVDLHFGLLNPAEGWLVVALRDVSDQEKLKERLGSVQRMEAVGRLAGGVAHDFNNALTVVLAGAGLVGEQLPPDSPAREDLEDIIAAAEHAASLTRQLLAFSRRRVVRPKVIDLDDLVRAVDRMLRRVLGEDIELRTLAGAPWPVEIDPGALEQVLLNLAVNARDAMPKGGQLSVETGRCRVEEGASEAAGVEPGDYSVLDVADTGHGMLPEVSARAFEPFFTTKPVGHGSGLGLSTAYGIIRQSGGAITIDSAPDRGARFRIYLPRCHASPQAPRPTSAAPQAHGGAEKILVVEDEPVVRRLVVRSLRDAGYRVESAEDGVEALKRFGDESFDLLLTDVVMPNLGGPELVSKLRARQPDLRVLYMSGYAEERLATDGRVAADLELIQKRFERAALLARIRGILDA